MVSTHIQLKTNLKKGEFSPIYLLYGAEPFFIDEIADFFPNIIPEEEKSFNEFLLYGRDTNTSAVVATCKQFPMLGNRQLVILREAQDLDLKKKESEEKLLNYIKAPQESTVLVICYKYKAPPSKILKAIEKSDKCVAFESKVKYESDIPSWLSTLVQEKGYKISPKAIQMLLELLGTNLEKIDNEINKLIINIGKGEMIDDKIVDKYIGVSKDFNVFELTNAIAFRNTYKAQVIVDYFANNPNQNPFPRTIVILFNFFNKLLLAHSLPTKTESEIKSKLKLNYYNMQEYFQAIRNYSPQKTVQIMSLIREYNLRSLGVDNASTSHGELLKELVLKIMS